ncbi:MAG TPA: hypothetical protein VF432_13200 [Thermoanaerobaculia bacterium]
MKVEHERALMLESIDAEAGKVPHRTHGILLRATLFVLTAIGVFALTVLWNVGIAGVLSIALAEYLILARRWWWTGVEEALWIGGVMSLISELPNTGADESLLVIAAGAGLAGARVRNPLFGAVAASFVAAYFEKRFDLGVVTALVIALAAAFALLRTWRRPSNEFLCIAIAAILPLVGYSQADANWRNATIALYLAFGLVTFFLALRYRHHALFLCGAIGTGVAAVEFARTLTVPLEAKLALGGAVLLAGAWLVSRALRDKTTGIVSTPASLTPFDDDLEIAATVALPRADFDQKSTGGGEFGGAGATGKY